MILIVPKILCFVSSYYLKQCYFNLFIYSPEIRGLYEVRELQKRNLSTQQDLIKIDLLLILFGFIKLTVVRSLCNTCLFVSRSHVISEGLRQYRTLSFPFREEPTALASKYIGVPLAFLQHIPFIMASHGSWWVNMCNKYPKYLRR